MSLKRKQIFLPLAISIFVVSFLSLFSILRPMPALAFAGCTYTYGSSTVGEIRITCDSSSRFGELDTVIANINDSKNPWVYQQLTEGTEENTGHSITIPDFENTPSQGTHSVFGNGLGGRVSEAIVVGLGDNPTEILWTEKQLEDLKSPTSPSSQTENCESVEMGWLVCPIIRGTDAALNWVDEQIARLLEIDQNQYKNQGIKDASAAIRNIAFIILVPIMLVMVIGTALGLSAIDAYTVKKALPRLVIAAIFISLSYPILVFLIEFSNSLGKGVLGLLTSPFGDEVSNLTLASLFQLGSGGSVFESIFAQAALTLGAVVMIWLFTGTLLLIAATGMLILLVRQIFIVGFFLMGPLAILAWIFPGNDKLWKIWWGSFSKLLMMFPLIMGIIAVGRIFAFIIQQPQQGAVQGSIIQPLMALMAYIIPYAAIPFTFKLAGGIFGTLTGMVNDKQKGLFDRMQGNRAKKLERTGRRVLQKRADYQSRLQNASSNTNRNALSRFALRTASKGVGGYNVMAADSARRAAVGKELTDQIATGRDDEIRGLTVNKSWADQHGREGVDYRTSEDGTKEYRTLGGAWVNEGAVIAGHKRWGNDTYAQQTALSYEMRKAATDGEVSRIAQRYQQTADGWGMNATQRAGALKGAGFENQGTHLEFKHMDANGMLNYDAFTSELYEKKGSYPLSQMSAHTVGQLSEAYTDAEASGNTTRMEQIRSISETFVQRGGIQGVEGQGAEAIPIQGAAAGGTREPIVSAPGAGHVNEAVQNLARQTGVIPQPGQGNGPPPAGPQGPPRQQGGPGDGGVLLG